MATPRKTQSQNIQIHISTPLSPSDLQESSAQGKMQPWRLNAIWSCILVGASSIFSGYDDKVISPIAAMEAFVHKYQGPEQALSARSQSLVFSVPLVGALLGSLVSGIITKSFSRRWTLIACYTLSYIGSFLQLFAPDVATFVVGRSINSGTYAICLSAALQYLSEVVTAPYRGRAVALTSIFNISTGLIASLITNRTHSIAGPASFMIPLGAQLVMPTLLIPATLFVTESPIFLISKGKAADARENLRHLRGQTDVEDELARMISDVQTDQERQNQVSILDLFRKGNLRRTLISGSVFPLNQVSGIILSTTYATVFLTAVGVNNPFALTIGATASLLAGTICGYLTVDTFGRRKVAMIGWTTVLIIDIIAGSLAFSPFKASIATTIAAMSFCLNFVWGLSFFTLSVILPAEIPSLRLRPMTAAYTLTCSNITAILTTCVVPLFVSADALDLGAKTYLIFAGCMVVIVIVYYYQLPETAGLTFGEIDSLYKQNVAPGEWLSADKGSESVTVMQAATI